MPFNLALADLVSPYLVRGENLGANHALLSAIRVVDYEFASDAFGSVIRGRCEFNGRGSLDVGRGSFSFDGLVDEAAPPFDPNRRKEIFDIRETSLDFELWVPRVGSNIIAAGVDGISDDDFGPTEAVLDVWDDLPLEPASSDFPASGFTLDLIVNAPTVRPPFFQPAKMTPAGSLVPDDAYQEVTLTLPKMRFRLSHNDGLPTGQGSALQLQLLSVGVGGLDDPGNLRVVEAISMEPPYAFIGRSRDRFIGFAFRKAVLDLSDNVTPPAVLEKFGFGDDWGGLYLPEVRLFVAPEGVRDMAFAAGVQDLLIGFGDSKGVSGDFEVALINQGSGELRLGARFFDEVGNVYDIERLSPDSQNAQVQIPQLTRMVVDIEGGRVPYDCEVSIGSVEGVDEEPLEGERVFTIDLEDFETREIRIEVEDSSFGTPIFAVLNIQVRQMNEPPLVLPAPGDSYPAAAALAVLAPGEGTEPRILIATQTDKTVWVTTEPWNASLLWSVPGSALPEEQEGEASSIFAVELAPGESKTVQARLPEAEITTDEERDFFFYYNEPKPAEPLANEATEFAEYGSVEENLWTTPALQEVGAERELGGSNALEGYKALLDNLSSGSEIIIVGDASYDGDNSADDRNYDLAIRRAKVVREIIQQTYSAKNFELIVSTDPEGRDAWTTAWRNRAGGEPVSESNPQQRWRATITVADTVVRPKQSATVELSRSALPPEPPEIVVIDEPPTDPPEAADWFRSARLKLRVVQDELIAFEIGAEIDLETAAEEQLRGADQIGEEEVLEVRSLEGGQPVDPENPADGITQLRLVAQSDSATGETSTLISIGADPADKDGLAMMGWLPGENQTAPTLGRSLVGSYLSFWPLLVDLAAGNQGDVEDAVLDAVKLAIPGAIAGLPWFTVERVILHGGEYEKINRNGQSEAFFFFDVEIGWSADISIGGPDPLIEIDPNYPLTVRYKAIGLRFGDIEGNAPYSLQPVFKASRGYTIDVAKSGALRINGTLGRILRVISARISRTNPLTFEIDVGMSADLGVISIERAAVRAYMNAPEGSSSIPQPELTALGASVNIPNTLVGSGYLAIDNGVQGQIDLTLVPLKLRISAALAIQNIDEEDGGPATAVYVGIEVILPVGIPLGASGLGIFGFRGIFGMHYQRNEGLGGGAAPTLGWLQAAEGQPHLLSVNNNDLWLPQIDNWAFGLGILIGTIEGGVIMNLDGTFLLELPGPRILIMMTARILSPPPGLDDLGATSGLLAVIEITPEHFLIGLIAEFSIRELISIVIPIEAFFGFKNPANWHVYLGSRSHPVTVDVLGIFEGTGYLMLDGMGLPAYKEKLDAIEGFAVGIGAAAALVWGDEEDGLYLRVGGAMDAILGFSPFILEGLFEVSGELRLYVISIGAHAELFVSLRETVREPGEPEPEDRLSLYIRGEACGHIRIFWVKLEGCVEITIRSQPEEPPIPALVKKLSIKSRSPALAQGTGTDRPIDASLGDAMESDEVPTLADLPVVPVDSIPFLSLEMPVQDDELTFFGNSVGGASGAPAPDGPSAGFIARGEGKYKYTLESVSLTRINPENGSVMGPTFVSGEEAPATWWLLNDINEPNLTAQLGLMTWEPTAASKAIEKTEELTALVEGRWGQICDGAAPPTPVLWTFRYEKFGISPLGWDLEGIAWPDADKGNRSEAPDTSLVVSERWRSGDETLDGRRGLVGASVIGVLTPCEASSNQQVSIGQASTEIVTSLPSVVVGGRGPIRETTSSNKGQAVGEDDPVRSQLIRKKDKQDGKTPFRITPRLHKKVSQTADQLSTAVDPQQKNNLPAELSDKQIAKRLAKGALGPQDLLQAVSAPSIDELAINELALDDLAIGDIEGIPTHESPNICIVKVLQAPQFDNGDPVVFGNPDDQAEIAAALADAGVSHGPYDDAVLLHTGPFYSTTLLLFTWLPLLVNNNLAIRVLDDDGNELQEIRPDASDLLETKGLPNRWADATGPWADDIDDFVAWAAHLADPKNRVLDGLVPVLVDLSVQEDAAQIEISVVPGPIPEYDYLNVPEFGARYFVAAVECLRLTEVRRAQWDDSQIQRDRDIITSILGPESSDNAFLYPDSLYRVRATWRAERETLREAGRGEKEIVTDSISDQTQAFWFRTDDAPPARLNPWMLMTIPADQERHVFYGDPLQLVFNTHDLDRLYDAYGHDLTVRLQAASAHHPPEDPEGPTRIVPPALEPAGAEVLSPWEATLEEVLSDSCIPIDKSREYESKITLPILFDPYTDYILDIEAVDRESETTFSVYRRHFSTGGYRHQAEFAQAISSQFIEHRAVPVGSMAAIRGYFGGRVPQGAEFDEQWRSQGLDILPTPEKPRILVLWEQTEDGLPQPAAVLIDAPEPLERSRLYPKLTTDNSGDIPVQRWELKPDDWLIVSEPEDSEPIIDAQINVPGNQRMLIVLRPNSRGQLLRLNLVGLAFPEPYLGISQQQHSLVKIRFTHAPWEEV